MKATADKLNQKLQAKHGHAYISVNKAVVTQASAAIPVVPLYISLLFKVMKENGTHEGCIEQIYRLFKDNLYAEKMNTDTDNYIRIDDLEMDPEVQQKVAALWPKVYSENLEALADVAGYRHDFYRLFGFNVDGFDYNVDVNPDVKIDSI